MIFEPLSFAGRRVLLDTDIGPDCDDAGALALLISMSRKYGFEIAGVVNCTSNRFGTGAIAAIARRCGLDGLRIGEYENPGFLDTDDCCRYNRYLTEKMLPEGAASAMEALPAGELYRRVLSESEDDGLMLVSIGPLNTLSNALTAFPELIEKKVHCLVSMACAFPSGREYNIFCDAAAAKNVIERFPKPIFFSGYEVGGGMLTGFPDCSEEKHGSDPVFTAYRLYTNGRCVRDSFDLTAVQFAAEGEGDFYRLSNAGSVKIAPDGSNSFEENEGKHYYMIKTAPDEVIAAYLNEHISL